MTTYVHVQNMNIRELAMKTLEDRHRELRLLDELAQDGTLSQRDLSKRVGIALGLINSYLKNLAAKGYIKVAGIPPKRYSYYLTRKGFLEKSRLTYDLLQNYTRVFNEARSYYSSLFRELHSSGVRTVFFAGVDEVTEIAYLSMLEFDLQCTRAFDDIKAGENFFRIRISSFADLQNSPKMEHFVITSYRQKDEILKRLLDAGIKKSKIHSI